MTSPQPAGTEVVFALRYVDRSGTVQVFTDYVVQAGSDPVQVFPARGYRWPCTAEQAYAVEVLYWAGYANDVVPAQVARYASVRFGQLYQFRELVVSGTQVQAVPYLRNSLENIRARWWSVT